MVEQHDERESTKLAIGLIRQHGPDALDHVITLITAAVRDGDDETVRRLDRAMRYIEHNR